MLIMPTIHHETDDSTVLEEFEVQDLRADLPIFIHSELDDLNLSPEAFRVYAHLVRRGGRDGKIYPKLDTIADICFGYVQRLTKVDGKETRLEKQLTAATRRKMTFHAIEALIERGLIRRIRRKNKSGKQCSNVYQLLPKDQWDISDLPRSSHDHGKPKTEVSRDRPTITGRDRDTITKVLPSKRSKGTPLSQSKKDDNPQQEIQSVSEQRKIKPASPLSSSDDQCPNQNPKQAAPPQSFAPPPQAQAQQAVEQTKWGGELPPWKTGHGINDWNEDVLEALRAWLSTIGTTKRTRADAIAYISKRKNPACDDYPTLLARVEEIVKTLAQRDRTGASQRDIAGSDGMTPEDRSRQLEALRKKQIENLKILANKNMKRHETSTHH